MYWRKAGWWKRNDSALNVVKGTFLKAESSCFFCTKLRHPFPRIISNRIRINQIHRDEEGKQICYAYGVEAQSIDF